MAKLITRGAEEKQLSDTYHISVPAGWQKTRGYAFI